MRGPRAHIFFLVDMEVINFFFKIPIRIVEPER
jgi:hypothetical protein